MTRGELTTIRTFADDSPAHCLLRRAQGAVQKWPEDFVGFRAEVRCRRGDREASGAVTVRPGEGVAAELADPELVDWLVRVLTRVAEQHTPRFFKDGDGRFPVVLGPADEHPLGRLVHVERPDGVRVAYRIDARGRIRQEERLDAGVRTVTTYEELVRATPGRILPGRMKVAAWDLRAGALLEAEDIRTTHRRICHVWLPEARRADITRRTGSETAFFELSCHCLL